MFKRHIVTGCPQRRANVGQSIADGLNPIERRFGRSSASRRSRHQLAQAVAFFFNIAKLAQRRFQLGPLLGRALGVGDLSDGLATKLRFQLIDPTLGFFQLLSDFGIGRWWGCRCDEDWRAGFLQCFVALADQPSDFFFQLGDQCIVDFGMKAADPADARPRDARQVFG